MNPCPCGFFNDASRECKCSPVQIQCYVSKISGPLLDLIDIHIDVPAVKFKELASDTPVERLSRKPRTSSSRAECSSVVFHRANLLQRPDVAAIDTQVLRDRSASKALLENSIRG